MLDRRGPKKSHSHWIRLLKISLNASNSASSYIEWEFLRVSSHLLLLFLSSSIVVFSKAIQDCFSRFSIHLAFGLFCFCQICFISMVNAYCCTCTNEPILPNVFSMLSSTSYSFQFCKILLVYNFGVFKCLLMLCSGVIALSLYNNTMMHYNGGWFYGAQQARRRDQANALREKKRAKCCLQCTTCSRK